MEPSSKKRRLESGRCEHVKKPDLEAQQLFAQMREALQRKTLTVEDMNGFENQFQQILQKHKSHITDLESEVSALRTKTARKPISSTTATESKQPERTAAEFAGEERIATMTKVQFSNPKGKMFVEFFPSYMTIRPQTRYDSADPAIVCYDDINIFISVPTKHRTSSLSVLFMKNKVPLRYQKANRSSGAFCMTFESTSDPEDYQVEVNVTNLRGKADLPAVMKGTREGIFNEIVSKLSGLEIQRHDKTVFRSAMGNTQFFVTSAIGASTGDLYPLRCGLLFTKPLMLIPVSNMESFHSGRDTKGTGLRFFDFDVVRKEVVGKQKKNESFSMISVSESPGIMAYFNTVKVPNTAVIKAAREKKEAENTKNAEEKERSDGQNTEVGNGDSNPVENGATQTNEADDDSMDSDDSMFDLEEELDSYYQSKANNESDDDYEDSGGDSSEDDMEEMRQVAAKEKTKPKAKESDVVDHDVVRARNDGGNSGSSTESDESMNEPLFPTSAESDVEMDDPTKENVVEKSSASVVIAKPTNTSNPPRRWKRRGKKPQASRSDNKNPIDKFFKAA